MSGICFKMPPLTKVDAFQDWASYLDYLYNLYMDDFIYNNVYFRGVPVKTFTNLEYNGKQQTFNHITTEGSRDRLYNYLRCERYKWIKAMIEEKACENCEDLAIWPEVRRKKHNILIWCRKTNFVVVLEKRKTDYYLITAYCVTYPNKERDLRMSYNRHRIKNQSRLP
ncbi:MAG: hypothetical protein GX892_17585 [Thermoanaerobacteraceae bacterium]|nr:hypothetical protein [Thermoanaerobacteraceae bacterium]